MRTMNQRGSLYILSLGVVVLLTVASASLLVRGISETNGSERVRNQAIAFQLADAGVDQAALNLRTPLDSADDVTQKVLLGGQFTIDPPANAPSGSATWQVTTHGASTADSANPRHIEATFQLVPESVFQFALFGDQQVNLGGNAISDSYDSRNGPYDSSTNHGHEGDVGTNAKTAGGIPVGASIFIDGQVAVGPNVADPASVVTGCTPTPSCFAPFITGGTDPPSNTQDIVSQDASFPLPDVSPPAGLSCSDYTITGGTQLTLSPTGGPLGNGTYCYRNLTVQGNAQLTATGSVKVYLTGELIARGNSTIGVPSDPRAMTILMTPSSEATLEEGTLTGSTEFYGALYGPKASLTISGNAEIYGSIIAKKIDVTGSAAIHYDQAMTDLTDVSNLYRTSLVSWRERTDL